MSDDPAVRGPAAPPRRGPDDGPDDDARAATTADRDRHVAEVLRERVYGDVGCLAALLLLSPDLTPWAALFDVAVTMGGLWAASLFADVVSEVVVHRRVPRGAAALRVLRTTGQILEAAVLPALLLVAAGVGWIPLGIAVRLGTALLVLTLGLFAAIAARRLPVPGWQRLLFVVALLSVGGLVVLLKTLH